MLNYMSVFGRDAEFTMDYGGGISKNKIRLMVSGNPIDPFNLTENASDEEQGLANILSRIGQRPKWKYARGVNTIIYTLAKIIGLTMLVISKNTQVVAELSEQLGFIVDGIMSFISKLVPVFVFGSLFNIIASSDLSSLAAGGKFFAGTLAGCVLLILFHNWGSAIVWQISAFRSGNCCIPREHLCCRACDHVEEH